MTSHDVVVVGGAAMGSSAAYYLKLLAPDLSVAVVEKDPSYEFCSTLRSDGNVRIQFNLVENIQMSLLTMELLETFSTDMAVDGWSPDPAPRRQGNLFLIGDGGRADAESAMILQRSMGCDVEWLDPDEIAARFPAYRPDGVIGGVFGPSDGTIDPTALLHGYRRNAAALGADYVVGEVAGIELDGGRIAGVSLQSGERLTAPTVINCTGGWARQLTASVGIDLPVQPVMRTVFVVDTAIPAAGLPLVFTPQSAYVFPEGGTKFAMAWSLESDPVGFDFTFNRRAFYDEVWPEIVGTLPAFDRLEVVGGWTGLYAVNSFDGNAILGEWPELSGLYLANGFSGHGLQHTPAMGRHLAELITGREPSLDLGRFSPRRVIDGTPVFEHESRLI